MIINRAGLRHSSGGAEDHLWGDPPEHFPVARDQGPHPRKLWGSVAQGKPYLCQLLVEFVSLVFVVKLAFVYISFQDKF